MVWVGGIQVPADTDSIRLTHFRVRKLFGEFDHEIPLSRTSHITALIAPNGMGKTACLRLINALFRRQWSVLGTTEYDFVQYDFSDGSRVVVRNNDQDDIFEEGERSIVFETYRDGVIDTWSPQPTATTPNPVRVEQFLSFLTRIAPGRWVHDYTRQVFNLQEVIDQFGDQLPDSLVATLKPKPSDVLSSIIDNIDCHLIETQRLLIFAEEVGRRGPASTLAISRKAQTLKSIISRDLAAYASLSQSLDRSFPKRVIQMGAVQPPENLKKNLAELDNLRRKLMDAGILDTESDDALLPPGNIDAAVAAVLSVYVTDNRRKLEFLSTILAKITLFKQLIDNRFKPKTLLIGRESGFSILKGDDVSVPLDKLSSGEQHQLVLFFELLFELKENALILIDEPELSLHVAWQKKFIPDLQRIIELNKFDVLLATHSPQLIGHWEDLVVELGDVDAE